MIIEYTGWKEGARGNMVMTSNPLPLTVVLIDYYRFEICKFGEVERRFLPLVGC